MGSLRKLEEITSSFEAKKGEMMGVMGLVMRECDKVDSHYKSTQDFFRGCFAELESKEKHFRVVQESVKQGFEYFDSKKRSTEEGLKRLEEKEKLLKRVLQEIELKKMEFGKTGVSVDKQMQDVDLKEKEILGLFEGLTLIKRQLEAKERELEKREVRINEGKRMLEGMQYEINEENQRLVRRSNELDERERNLVQREKEFASKHEMLEERYFQVDSEKRRGKQLAENEKNLGSIKVEYGVIPTKSAEVRKVGWKSVCLSELMNMDENGSKPANRNISILDKSSGQVKPHIIHKSDLQADENKKLARKVLVGEIWACFELSDAKDNMPRSYAQVMKVNDKGGQLSISVAWLQPCPVQKGELEWVKAGLPVTCGKFEAGRTSVESPDIFSHQIICDRYNSSIIIPWEGETWAIYKDWNIITWAKSAALHRHCKYEMVEILPYSKDGSSSFGVTVAHLDKVSESANMFKRRSSDSFLIRSDSLYRFSHKVPSIKRICIDEDGDLPYMFEVDLKRLPREIE